MGGYEITIKDDLLKLRERFMRPVIHRLSDGELISSPSDYSPGVGGRALPNHREMIESFLSALDAEGVVRALSAVSAELTEIDNERIAPLRTLVTSQIEAVRATDSAPGLDQKFVNSLIAGWVELGRDLKALQGIVVKGVYAWPWR
jgi:hypothetical protein